MPELVAAVSVIQKKLNFNNDQNFTISQEFMKSTGQKLHLTKNLISKTVICKLTVNFDLG